MSFDSRMLRRHDDERLDKFDRIVICRPYIFSLDTVQRMKFILVDHSERASFDLDDDDDDNDHGARILLNVNNAHVCIRSSII